MEIKNYFAQDAQGNIMPSANCYLYLPGTTTLATGLVDGNGVPISNPFLSSSIGQVTFGAPNGVYDLRISQGARDTTIEIQCADLLQVMDETASFLGAKSSAPTTRNDGSALQIADRYFNTADQLEYLYKSTGWVANNLDGQLLATSQGASLLGAVMQDGSAGTIQQSINLGDDVLRKKLLNLEYGAGIVFGSSRQIFGFNKLKVTSPRYDGDKVDVVSHVFPTPANGPVGSNSFVWVPDSTETPDGATVEKVDGIDIGRWICQGYIYKDVDFGIIGNGDETEIAKRMFSTIPSGSTLRITKRIRANDLVCNANSVLVDSDSASYFDSPGIDAINPSSEPLLRFGGYGCKIGSLWVSDSSVDFGTVNAGSIGVEFRRADGKKDLDAYVSGLNVSKFATGLHKVGINCRTLGGGNIFSHCLDSVVVDQVTEVVGGVPTLQDVRGIIVGGGARFHGRPAFRVTDGVSAPIAGSLGTDILVNGTVQRENQFFNNLADGSGKHFRGQLGRGCLLTATSVRTPGGDAVAVTGGVSGEIDMLSISGGEGSGLVFEGGNFIGVNALHIDTVFKHGVVAKNCSDISFTAYRIMNVNGSGVPADAGLYSGFSIEATATLTTLGAGRIRQTGALSGDVGIDNQGNQTKISPECDAINFTNGPIRQSPTQRVYGDIGLMSNRPLVMYASSPPTTGTYGNGDRCKNNSPTIANPVTTWMYTVGALWGPVEWRVFSGSTSLRPVLRSADVGVPYIDTTIGGKQIVWNGTVWKDATGATV